MDLDGFIWAALVGVGMLSTTGILIQVGGYFPKRVRPIPLSGKMNEVLIFILLALGLTMLVELVIMAINNLPFTFSFIAGGLGFLVAPLIWQVIPRKVIDSRLGIIIGIAISSVAVTLLVNINQ